MDNDLWSIQNWRGITQEKIKDILSLMDICITFLGNGISGKMERLQFLWEHLGVTGTGFPTFVEVTNNCFRRCLSVYLICNLTGNVSVYCFFRYFESPRPQADTIQDCVDRLRVSVLEARKHKGPMQTVYLEFRHDVFKYLFNGEGRPAKEKKLASIRGRRFLQMQGHKQLELHLWETRRWG